MAAYLTEDFLLHSKTARELYHEHAEKMPVLDYHSHLSSMSIAEDATFDTISNLWLDHDHYKWRAMRANGIDEFFITGKAPNEERFMKWAATVSRAVRNPLFDWTHLELKRYFGISDTLLSPESAGPIYATCNEKLKDRAFSAKNLLRLMHVRVVCTTDDPVDDLKYHSRLLRDNFEIKVLPTFRPDKAFGTHNPSGFNAYLETLSAAADCTIASFEDLIEALDYRHTFFHDHGCRSADFAFETIPAEPFTTAEISATFALLRSGKSVNETSAAAYKSALLLRENCAE